MRRLTVAALVVLAMVAAACTSTTGTSPEDPTTSTGAPSSPAVTGSSSTTPAASPGGAGPISGVAERFDPSAVQFVAALQRFDECDGFLEHMRTEALARVGPYGLDGPGRPIGRGFSTETTNAAAQESAFFGADDAGDGGGVAFSGTNVQVTGVDEPDIVKTDGERIVAIVDGRLHHVDVRDAVPRLTDSVRLPQGWDHRLFLHGDQAFVISGGGGEAIPLLEDARLASIFPPFEPTITVTEIDLSNPDELAVGRTLHVQGSFVAARAVDDTVRLVATSFPVGLQFVFPSGPGAEDIAEETNRRIIAESTLETWLPTYVLADGDEVLDSGVLASCDQIHRPAEFAGFEMLSVTTFDLSDDLTPGDTTTLTARGETVYASPESLYVATNVWVPPELAGEAIAPAFDERFETALHKFSIGGSEPARYEASGSVPGHLLNQFSLNEHDGFLQVATTEGSPWSVREESESFVTVFGQDGDRLEQVGRVGDLGRGERIFSARFLGEQAYVVTFRQVDPLYVVDLRDPAAPEVTGELKIPGFSSYLHPLDAGRLLGVGQDATGEGRVTGAKVSLFDVSDPGDPREVDTWTMPGAASDVEWDHRAFLYWAPEEKVALPVTAWNSGFFGAVVLDIDDGLAEAGRITHAVEDGELSDCEPLTAEVLGVPEISVSPEFRGQLCGPDDAGGLGGGFYCDVVPEEELFWLLQEFTGGVEPDIEGLTAGGNRVEVCWPDHGGTQVLRSLVIGDDLWTLSRHALQANDLATLDLTQVVPLP